MKKFFQLLLLLFLISKTVFAQAQKIKYKKTPSGLEYAIIKKGKGPKPQKGNRVYVNFTMRIKPDSVFDSNSSQGKPYSFIIGQEEVLKGWDEGIALLSEGDSACFRIPPSLAFGEKKLRSIPANTTLLLEIRVTKVEQAFYNLSGKDTSSYKSGLKKILIAKGSGEKANPFYYVTLQFTAYVLSQKGYKQIFQSSLTNSTVAVFQLGSGRMVKGLDEGITTMNIGEKATFIVPPSLGFGKEKNGIVLGNSTLYFDVELLNCKDPFFHSPTNDTLKVESGIKIIPIIKQEQNKRIRSDEVVTFDFTAYFIDSLGHPIIFDNTIERKQPAILRPGSKTGVQGLEIALTYLRKNEQAKVIIPAILAFGNRPKGRVPANSKLYYDITIVDTKEYPFFEAKGLDTIKSHSGLKYIQIRKGTGTAVDTGSNISVAYTGFIIDSLGFRRIFDASRESHKNLEFVLGKGKVIKGFDEGIKGMCLGEGRRLIIPYSLAYGEKGLPDADIPKKATLYFDVELIEIKK